MTSIRTELTYTCFMTFNIGGPESPPPVSIGGGAGPVADIGPENSSAARNAEIEQRYNYIPDTSSLSIYLAWGTISGIKTSVLKIRNWGDRYPEYC